MELTKKILKEELMIFNERLKLTPEMLSLIEDERYVKNVLGVSINLNEQQNLEIRRLIINEALSLQNFIQSIQQKIGDKVNDVITGVKDIKDVISILYKILTDKTGNLIIKAQGILSKAIDLNINVFTQKTQLILNQFNGNINNLNQQIENIREKVTTLSKKLVTYNGIIGILATLGFATLIQWVNEKIIDNALVFITKNFLPTLVKSFESFSMFFKEIISNLKIEEIINYFTNFDNYLGGLVNTTEIIRIMAVILKPVVYSIDLTKRNR